MLFSLNVLEEMQERFGGLNAINEAMEGTEGMKNVKWLFARAINEGTAYTHFVDTGKLDGAETLDEKTIGLLLNAGQLMGLKTDILRAFTFAVRGDNPAQDDEGGEDEAGGNTSGEA